MSWTLCLLWIVRHLINVSLSINLLWTCHSPRVINSTSAGCQPSSSIFLIFLLSVMEINLAIGYIFDTIFWYFTFINENTVSVPAAPPSIPWHNRQISFPDDIPHSSLYFRCLIRWWYFNNSPVSLSITELAHLHMKFIVNLLAARCWLDNSVPVLDISNIRISVSCVLILWIPLERVLTTGFFSVFCWRCSFALLFL